MGSLSNEYAYRLMKEEGQDDYLYNQQVSQNTLFNKYVMRPATTKYGKYGALGTTFAPGISKFILGMNTGGKATELAKQFGTDVGLVQAAGYLPYFLQTSSQTASQINQMKEMNAQAKYADNFKNYDSLAQAGHLLSAMKPVTNIAAGGAVLAGLTGHAGLATALGYLNPMMTATHAGMGITGALGLGSMTGMLPAVGLAALANKAIQSYTKPKQTAPKFTMIPPQNGSQILLGSSTYNRHNQTITLLQSQNLLKPGEALIAGILNDINLNTTTLRLNFQEKHSNQKENNNVQTRNSLNTIFDTNIDTGAFDGPEIDKKELNNRRMTFHAIQMLQAKGMLASSYLLGPLSKLLLGKNYQEMHDDMSDILYSQGSAKVKGLEQTSKKLNLPTNLVQAAYTPVTKWLEYPTYQDQMLAITANIHELQRISALSLLDMRTSLGGQGKQGTDLGKGKTGSIFTLLEDEVEMQKQDHEKKDLGTLVGAGGLAGHLLKKILPSGEIAWNIGKKVGYYGTMAALMWSHGPLALATLPALYMSKNHGFHNLLNKDAYKEEYHKYRKFFTKDFWKEDWKHTAGHFGKARDLLRSGLHHLGFAWQHPDVIGEKIGHGAASLYSKVKGNLKDTLLKSLGFATPDQIKGAYDKARAALKTFDPKTAAYKYLGKHFPNHMNHLLHYVKHISKQFDHLLRCQHCGVPKMDKLPALWRPNFGGFMGKEEYERRLHQGALASVRDTFGINIHKNGFAYENRTSSGIGGFLAKHLGIRNRDLTKDLHAYNEIAHGTRHKRFASGGYTGTPTGHGFKDKTGHEVAGIVHKGEMVLPKHILDRNPGLLNIMQNTIQTGSFLGGLMKTMAMGALNKSADAMQNLLLKRKREREFYHNIHVITTLLKKDYKLHKKDNKLFTKMSHRLFWIDRDIKKLGKTIKHIGTVGMWETIGKIIAGAIGAWFLKNFHLPGYKSNNHNNHTKDPNKNKKPPKNTKLNGLKAAAGAPGAYELAKNGNTKFTTVPENLKTTKPTKPVPKSKLIKMKQAIKIAFKKPKVISYIIKKLGKKFLKRIAAAFALMASALVADFPGAVLGILEMVGLAYSAIEIILFIANIVKTEYDKLSLLDDKQLSKYVDNEILNGNLDNVSKSDVETLLKTKYTAFYDSSSFATNDFEFDLSKNRVSKTRKYSYVEMQKLYNAVKAKHVQGNFGDSNDLDKMKKLIAFKKFVSENDEIKSKISKLNDQEYTKLAKMWYNADNSNQAKEKLYDYFGIHHEHTKQSIEIAKGQLETQGITAQLLDGLNQTMQMILQLSAKQLDALNSINATLANSKIKVISMDE